MPVCTHVHCAWIQKVTSFLKNCFQTTRIANVCQECSAKRLDFSSFYLWSGLHFQSLPGVNGQLVWMKQANSNVFWQQSQELYLKHVLKSTFSIGFLKQYTKVNILEKHEKIPNILTDFFLPAKINYVDNYDVEVLPAIFFYFQKHYS